MIFDHLKNSTVYESCHPLFSQAFAFIERAIREELPVGRYEINGERLYAIVQEYDTKDPAICRLEGHRRYIDIQVILSGRERMGVLEASRTEAVTEYDFEKDFAFFSDAEAETVLDVAGGEFAIFYPHDIHRPGMASGASAPIRKIVVKVAVE